MRRLGDRDRGCAVDGAGQALADQVRHHYGEAVVSDPLRQDRLVAGDERAHKRCRAAGEELTIRRGAGRHHQVTRGLSDAHARAETPLRQFRRDQAGAYVRKARNPKGQRRLPNDGPARHVHRVFGGDVGLVGGRRRARRQRQGRSADRHWVGRRHVRRRAVCTHADLDALMQDAADVVSRNRCAGSGCVAYVIGHQALPSVMAKEVTLTV